MYDCYEAKMIEYDDFKSDARTIAQVMWDMCDEERMTYYHLQSKGYPGYIRQVYMNPDEKKEVDILSSLVLSYRKHVYEAYQKLKDK
ncbi:hypothetical protein DPQ33_04210 [Oceanidesulfovibrio indonesiensis]|uniref:Uncharacterized protein n=2 Tax=Oceanidesulfovibrio indonesiensis TaxID=54767 RepID=A0A7M3MGS6_9BACT|nr:hypothetical protein DPQ33_04210 [Oceanidesulfovibrio indonesiensis]